MKNLNERCEPFALYLPSIQKGYAKSVYKRIQVDRPFPSELKYQSLNFLNPKCSLWHYKYALYSVGQFALGEQYADIVTNRDREKTLILGDSGGFQIGKGTFQGFNDLKNCRNAAEVCERWRSATSVKQWIISWLETHCDYAMTIDMPLWAQFNENRSTPFHRCSTEQLVDLTVENLKFIRSNRLGQTKWLNVIQGTNEKDMQLWWKSVNPFRFSGWALAGDTGWRGGVVNVVTQVLMMRDEDAFVDGLDWLHVLGVSQTKWAVILSAIQRGLRSYVNPKLRVSFDSASPSMLAGRYESVALRPKFTNDPKSWVFTIVKAPNAIGYTKETSKYAFPFESPLGDLLELHHINVKGERFTNVRYDDVSYHLLTNHNTWIYLRSMLEANELAFLEPADAKKFVPPKLLDCIHLIEDLMVTKNWKSKLKAKGELLMGIDALSKGDVI